MRRKDREITDKASLLEILRSSDICRVAINTAEAPYIIALNFGFRWEEGLELYFHCALEGRKIDLLQADNRVGFELEGSHEYLRSERACGWGVRYQSIVGNGIIEPIYENDQKRPYLDAIMEHYGFSGQPQYDEKLLDRTLVLKLTVTAFSGKAKA